MGGRQTRKCGAVLYTGMGLQTRPFSAHGGYRSGSLNESGPALSELGMTENHRCVIDSLFENLTEEVTLYADPSSGWMKWSDRDFSEEGPDRSDGGVACMEEAG